MVEEVRKKINKSQVLTEIKNITLIILGCALLAFGDAVFLTPANIVSGGVMSIGLIVDYYVKQTGSTFDTYDITVAIVQWVLFFVGLFFLGKKFSLQTLLASIVYPLLYSLFLRFNVGQYIGVTSLTESVVGGGFDGQDGIPVANLILDGIFGGALCGAGVAITFIGNGSTGGFDIVTFIIAKYTEMKQGLSSFIIDASIILIGMICMRNVVSGLVGMISAFVAAAMIQYIYVYTNSFVIVDIISEKYLEIQDYIHHEMGHGTTIFDTVGGYSGEKRKMVRVVVYQAETSELRSFIAKTDPKAFVSFMQAKTINGEGFEPFIIPKKDRKTRHADSGQYSGDPKPAIKEIPLPEEKETK
jgi:uncharacterized membrane-anchored protein YitT (DUF2179 family)